MAFPSPTTHPTPHPPMPHLATMTVTAESVSLAQKGEVGVATVERVAIEGCKRRVLVRKLTQFSVQEACAPTTTPEGAGARGVCKFNPCFINYDPDAGLPPFMLR